MFFKTDHVFPLRSLQLLPRITTIITRNVPQGSPPQTSHGNYKKIWQQPSNYQQNHQAHHKHFQYKYLASFRGKFPFERENWTEKHLLIKYLSKISIRPMHQVREIIQLLPSKEMFLDCTNLASQHKKPFQLFVHIHDVWTADSRRQRASGNSCCTVKMRKCLALTYEDRKLHRDLLAASWSHTLYSISFWCAASDKFYITLRNTFRGFSPKQLAKRIAASQRLFSEMKFALLSKSHHT